MSTPVAQILQVGAIGNPLINDGRLLPFLTVDCSKQPDLEQLIEVHGSTSVPGDVICTWSWSPFNKSRVYLKLDFSRPVIVSTLLAFPVEKHGYVVDWILSVRGIYLQSSKYGSCASEGLGKPAIVVEVPSNATFPIWQNLYKRVLKKKFKTEGLRGKDVERAINEYKARQREIWFRRPRDLSLGSDQAN